MRQILLSDAFYSEQAFQQHIKSPVEFVVGTVRELGVPVPAADAGTGNDRDGPGSLQSTQRRRLAGRRAVGLGEWPGRAL